MSEEIKIENALCFNLYSASRMMTQVYRPFLNELDLTYPQFLVLHILWENKNEAKSVKSIGERLYLDSGTLSPLLKRLEKNELITKTKSMDDERGVYIELSKKGKALEKKASKIPMEMFCKINLTEKRFLEVLEGVKEVLGNLHHHIEK